MADALWPLVYPVLAALATWWGAPVAVVLILAALGAGFGVAAAVDRLTVPAQHAMVTTALVVAIHAPTRTWVTR